MDIRMLLLVLIGICYCGFGFAYVYQTDTDTSKPFTIGTRITFFFVWFLVGFYYLLFGKK